MPRMRAAFALFQPAFFSAARMASRLLFPALGEDRDFFSGILRSSFNRGDNFVDSGIFVCRIVGTDGTNRINCAIRLPRKFDPGGGNFLSAGWRPFPKIVFRR